MLASLGPINQITSRIIAAAIEVHRTLGPGLLESVYHRCLVYELHLGALRVRSEKKIPVIYKGIAMDCSYELDLIVDDTVIVLPGGRGGKSVAAYDKASGAPVWTALDDRQAYTSPMLVTLGGVRQILVVSATRAMGLTADRGRLLWEYPWVTEYGINVSQPLLLGNDRFFLSAGYDHGAAVFEVIRAGEGLDIRTVWQNNRMKNKFTSSVLRNGYIYGLDEAILACVDAVTGELKWKGGRYGYGQILLAGDHLVVLAEDGDVALVKATPERHDEVAKFSAIDGKTWNHPVIVGGRLLVRNLREMAAFDIRP